MNNPEAIILDFVAQAEAPLYSTYEWMGQELGRNVSLAGFLLLVDEMIKDKRLRLWSVSLDTQSRRELDSVPDGLESAYKEHAHSDASYDPFALSLTLGPHAGERDFPDWDAELDFDAGSFEIHSRRRALGDGLEQIGRLFPEFQFEVVSVGPPTRGTIRPRALDR